jgi:predicted O-methyltransferase YrrM
VLWSGKVVQPEATKKDKELRAILAFNARIQQDDRVENVLLPLRDGLMVIRKK